MVCVFWDRRNVKSGTRDLGIRVRSVRFTQEGSPQKGYIEIGVPPHIKQVTDSIESAISGTKNI